MFFPERKGTGQDITTINIFCIGEILGDHYICVLCLLSGIFLSVVPTHLQKSQGWEYL